MRKLLFLTLISLSAHAHDVGVDVSGTLTNSSSNNPRVGSGSIALLGAYDFNDAWSLTGFALYTRDLGTRTADTSAPGSNVFLFNLGAMWLPTEHLMMALSLVGSPPTMQRNATTIDLPQRRTADVVIDSTAWSLGAQFNGLWASNGFSNLEHTIDVALGINQFSVFQIAALPDTPRGNAARTFCAARGTRFEACRLVAGESTALWQGRLGAGYTATLFRKTEVGVDGAYFLYDTPPGNVGYYSLLSVGRSELGSGVPVLPLLFTLRPHVSQRLGPVTLKLGYQFGLYTENLGALHALTLRATWRITTHWRITGTVTGQLDAAQRTVVNLGAQALLGFLYVW